MKGIDISGVESGALKWAIGAMFGAMLRRPNSDESIMFSVVELDEGWAVFVQELSGTDLNPEELANQPKRVIKHAASITEALTTAEQYGKEWLTL